LVLPFVLRSSVAELFLQSGQPYLWQLVALVWAWWALRAVFDGRSARARALAAVGVAAFTALAAWMNTASLFLVSALGVLEAFRARARPTRVLGPLAALVVAGLFEAGLRGRYNASCREAFGEAFITPLRFDGGQLLSNLGRVVDKLRTEGGQVPLLLGAALALVPGRSRTERFNQLGLLALATAALPALVAIRYFRDNHFAGRYFAFPTYWAIAAAVYGGLLVLASLARHRSGWVLAAALLALVVAVPAGPPDFLAPQRAEAGALAAGGPSVLLADYLDVYVPASLAPPGALLPVGAEGNLNRYPATQAELQPGRRVLAPCALDRPDGTMEQYGALLRRTTAPPIPGARFAWCDHGVERAARPVRAPR
jgi:hypothetical protein